MAFFKLDMLQEVKIDKVLYEAFDRFELEDISYLNRLSRYIEHSELSDAALNDRAFCWPESLEDAVIKKQEREALHKAIIKLPETQRRRLLLFFSAGLPTSRLQSWRDVNGRPFNAPYRRH